MNTPKIGQTLLRKRKQLCLTQEDIAEHFGVSKASVSKWETGQSFPDTLLLPRLASFFDISLDELFGYTPEISLQNIKRAYESFGKRYLQNDETVIQEIEDMIKKYYAYPQWILAMCQWFFNYGLLEKDVQKKEQMIARAYALSSHAITIAEKSSEVSMAEMINTTILFFQGEYQECLTTIGEEASIIMDAGKNAMLSQIYVALGKKEKALEVSQVNLYQNIGVLLDALVHHQSLNIEDKRLHDQIYRQVQTLITVFGYQKAQINPTFTTHLVAAQCAIQHQEYEEAIRALESYYQVIKQIQFPVKQFESAYFERVKQWIEENIFVGNIAPVTEEQIKSNLSAAILENPMFEVLTAYESYQVLLQNMKNLVVEWRG